MDSPVPQLIEMGLGYWQSPIRKPDLYGINYWNEYQRRSMTEIGRFLTMARVNMVKRHGVTSLLDVGIGSGAFIAAAGAAGVACYGTDVNPLALRWLRSCGTMWNGDPVEAATFWDSIEHIEDAGASLLDKTQWAFISTPIYDDLPAVLTSKHFKPGEHIWYFSASGLQRFMHGHGFYLMESNTMESDLGREGIGTFAFRRHP